MHTLSTATSHEPTKVRETLHQIESSPHPVKERWKPTVIPGAPGSLLTLAVVALSLVVLGLVFIIILMSLYIWKQTRSVLVVKGRRFVPNTDVMDYNQLQSSLDREDPGYTSPGSEEQQRAIGHRSEYMTTRSLEIAEMSTVMTLCYVILFLFIRNTKGNLECNKLTSYPCCVDQYLNKVNNSCTECPFGTFGINCKLSCPSGYYGRLCRSICECDVSECHHVTGCITTHGTTSVQPGERLKTEPEVNLSMNILTKNVEQKHMQGKRND
ncbi:uncharacterized protein LOC128190608 [Crassostrea angulata]|uniref:uncharacterized protein LOC128190608 n=1 Tax=Magallana angulata TaxID=2784310 RepID=UPI0022B09DBB|nr:uncharacterized protein LOC128190608 [Crassostrea angulata]